MKRVGIIGAKSMGRYHATRWARLPVELAGFYDRHPDRAQAAAENHGVPYYDEAQHLLDTGLDGAIITAENSRHLELVQLAAGQVPYLLCEKPIADNPEATGSIIDICAVRHARPFIPQMSTSRPIAAHSDHERAS